MFSATRSQNAFAAYMSCLTLNDASSIATLSEQPHDAFHLASAPRAAGSSSFVKKSRSSLPASATVIDPAINTPTSTCFITVSCLRFECLHHVIELDPLGRRLGVDDREVDVDLRRVKEVPRAIAAIEEHRAVGLAPLLLVHIDGLAAVAAILE